MNLQNLKAASVLLLTLVMLNCGDQQPQPPEKVSPKPQAVNTGKEAGSDSPITVGDGSMILISGNMVSLQSYFEMSGDPEDDDVSGVVHPQKKSMGQIYLVKASGNEVISGANCFLEGDQPRRCRVVLTWGEPQAKTKMVISTDRKGQGLVVRTNVEMKEFPGDGTTYEWKQGLSGATLKKAEFVKSYKVGNIHTTQRIDLCKGVATGECKIKISHCTLKADGGCE